MTLHPCALVTLSQTLMSYTNNLDNTLLKLNVDTKLLLIPNNFQLWNSRLEAKFTSRLNSSIQNDPPRNSLINSLDHTRSFHSLSPTLSPYDFQTVSVLYTQFSCLHVGTSNSKSDPQLHSTPTPANYC